MEDEPQEAFGGHDNTEWGKYAPDEKGREHPHTMSDREILEELLLGHRKVVDLVNGFFADFKNGKINPLQMMGGMFKR